MSDPETLAALQRIEDLLQKQGAATSRAVSQASSAAWWTGATLALGMNVALDPNPSSDWAWSLLSWGNAGWLLFRHLAGAPG